MVAADGKSCEEASNWVLNCLFMRRDGVCVRCLRNYNYDTAANTCTRFMTGNCLIAESANQCRVCIPGYHLTGENDCTVRPSDLPEIDYCILYKSEKRCAQCAPPKQATTAADDGYDTCETDTEYASDPVEFCVWVDKGFCTACDPLYALFTDAQTGSSQCISRSRFVIDNCKNYLAPTTSSFNCQVCEINYYLDRDSTGKTICRPTNPVTVKCESYKDKRCEQCVKDHVLTPDFLCVRVAVPIDNCYQYSYNTLQNTPCVFCNEGFILADGACVPNTGLIDLPFCVAYRSLTQCQACGPAHFLTASGCKPLSGPPIPGCEEYAGAAACARCDSSHQIENGTCLPLEIPNCKYLSNNYNCGVCVDDYVPMPDGTCRPIADTPDKVVPNCVEYNIDQKCTACPHSYALESSSGTCVSRTPFAAIDRCLKYASGQICALCEEGSHPSVGQVPNSCQNLAPAAAVPNCKYHKAPSICVECEPAFLPSLSGQTCLQNCEKSAGESCVRCLPGFIL